MQVSRPPQSAVMWWINCLGILFKMLHKSSSKIISKFERCTANGYSGENLPKTTLFRSLILNKTRNTEQTVISDAWYSRTTPELNIDGRSPEFWYDSSWTFVQHHKKFRHHQFITALWRSKLSREQLAADPCIWSRLGFVVWHLFRQQFYFSN